MYGVRPIIRKFIDVDLLEYNQNILPLPFAFLDIKSFNSIFNGNMNQKLMELWSTLEDP